jgi:hypothetical protein
MRTAEHCKAYANGLRSSGVRLMGCGGAISRTGLIGAEEQVGARRAIGGRKARYG